MCVVQFFPQNFDSGYFVKPLYFIQTYTRYNLLSDFVSRKEMGKKESRCGKNQIYFLPTMSYGK